MLSIPYSRYLIEPIPWYSFLIVLGAALAVWIASRKEKEAGLPKDTIIDLALWLLPAGIIGARIYYVLFSWEQFRYDFISVFRIWEGGLAIYGGLIAGFLTLLLFCRHRHLSVLTLCDLIVPGLALAQAIGRWGNYFNIEAYGLEVSNPLFCFFPLAIQVPAEGGAWHLATFFYESLWNFLIFIILIKGRKKMFSRQGDCFFFYLFLYAAGRLVIEDLRLDSLYLISGIRISQLLSVLLCLSVLLRYTVSARKNQCITKLTSVLLLPLSLLLSVLVLLICIIPAMIILSGLTRSLLLALYSVLMIFTLFSVFIRLRIPEVLNADNRC